MAWTAGTSNDSTENKMLGTLNGPGLFYAGAFSMNYTGAGYTIGASGTGGVGDAEWSIFSGQNATTNANFTANTVSTAANPTVMSYVNLSGDPTGKSPASTLYLGGSSQLNVPTAPLGSLTLGTWLSGRIIGKFNVTGTPTFQVRMHLRSPVTGKVVYVISDSTAFTTITGSNGLGLKINPSLIVTSGGSAGQIVSSLDMNYGINGYQSSPTITTVDCTQSYIIDVSIKWGTASASNSVVIYGACFELVG